MPSDAASQELGKRYLRSWEALGKMLEEGKSWSGRERNLCYLNEGNGRFSDVSALSGMDWSSDSRAQALTDWDGDGDLDVWQANRTAPRVRFLLNQLGDSPSLQLKLVGQQCNRDAIGARVIVSLSNGKRLLRSLRAGEGYLGQSSKLVHVGIPIEAKITDVSVQWPGGESESFPTLTATGRYVLTQGRGATPDLSSPRTVHPKAAEPHAIVDANTRLVPHGKLPLPSLRYTSQDGTEHDLTRVNKPTLVLLWASWCQPCLHEIEVLKNAAQELEQAGLQVSLINVEPKPEWNTQVPDGFLQGHATPSFLEAYDVIQRALPGREREPVLPSSFLLSASGELVVFYRGAVTAEVAIEDVRLSSVTPESFRAEAVPFPGTWLMRSTPIDLLAVPGKLLGIGQTESAFNYLERHVIGGRKNRAMPLVSKTYAETGRQFSAGNEPNKAKQALIRALQYQPRDLDVRVQLAMLYDRLREHGSAITQYREVLKLQPDHLAVLNSLAWLLATAPDANLRDPAESARLAEQVCKAVDYAMPEPLDTLAAAHAASGKFPEAIASAERGLLQAEQQGNVGVAKRLQERLALYRIGKAFIQAAQ